MKTIFREVLGCLSVWRISVLIIFIAILWFADGVLSLSTPFNWSHKRKLINEFGSLFDAMRRDSRTDVEIKEALMIEKYIKDRLAGLEDCHSRDKRAWKNIIP